MARRIRILDGGMGRELKRMGAPFRQPEWSALPLMEAPEFITRAHESFIAAGAEVITTNSYALVPFHIGEERFAKNGQDLADLAGRLARAAADTASASGRDVLVAASLPPLFGSYRPDLFDGERAPALLKSLVAGLSPYADVWLAETMGSIEEAQAARDALDPGDARPFWISFTLADEKVGDAPCLRSGESVVEAVQAAVGMNAKTLLFNCSQPEAMGPAIDAARKRLSALKSEIEIGVYANAFPPVSKDAKANTSVEVLRSDLDPNGYLAFAQDWVNRGATLVGGCCGIGPEHIASLRAAFK